MKKFWTLLACIAILASSSPRALAFDPEFLLSDSELDDSYAMDLNQVQAVLSQGSLGTYRTMDHEGVERSAAEIIWRAAQKHQINPKFLIVLIQKEQSLVDDPEPTQNQLDWATGYGICDDCSKSDATVQRWRGFGKQINSAAMQFREGYLTDIEIVGITQGKYGPGLPVEIDGEIVIPDNAITAALYAYTPHFHGNRNFVTLWDRYFGLAYPTGTLVKAENAPDIYLVEYGYKRHIKNWTAFISRFDPSRVISVGPSVIESLPLGRDISLPNYSLLRDENQSLFLLVDDSLRPIASLDDFHAIGFNEDMLVDVKNEEREAFALSDPLSADTLDPQGRLVKLTGGAIYYLQDGVRHYVGSADVAKARFPQLAIQNAAPTIVEQYREGKSISMPDGYLVKSPTAPDVFVISEGKLRRINSETTFLSYGWHWDEVLTLPASVLKLSPEGEPLPEPGGLNLASE